MSGNDLHPKCRVCGKPVGPSQCDFGRPPDVHAICYHFAVDHDANPDHECGKIDCPQFLLGVYRVKLARLGVDTDDLVEEALQERIARRRKVVRDKLREAGKLFAKASRELKSQKRRKA